MTVTCRREAVSAGWSRTTETELLQDALVFSVRYTDAIICGTMMKCQIVLPGQPRPAVTPSEALHLHGADFERWSRSLLQGLAEDMADLQRRDPEAWDEYQAEVEMLTAFNGID